MRPHRVRALQGVEIAELAVDGATPGDLESLERIATLCRALPSRLGNRRRAWES